jgi:hypothetical protein
MKQKGVVVLRVPVDTLGVPVADASDAWTLVDYLFPGDRAPKWSGSVIGDGDAVLSRTA